MYKQRSMLSSDHHKRMVRDLATALRRRFGGRDTVPPYNVSFVLRGFVSTVKMFAKTRIFSQRACNTTLTAVHLGNRSNKWDTLSRRLAPACVNNRRSRSSQLGNIWGTSLNGQLAK